MAASRGPWWNGVLEGRAIPAELREQVVERTDGVPLFIEEVTKTLVAAFPYRRSRQPCRIR